MPVINNFYDLDCWKEAKLIFKSINTLVKLDQVKKEYYLRDQMLRASLSISNNIAEGFERGGSKEFRRFLIIANGSAAEVKSMLLLLLEVEKGIPEENIREVIDSIDNCMKMTKGLIKYLNSKIERA